jgi:hypothetical protein
MPTRLTRIRAVSHDADPLAHQPGPWKVGIAGRRWFGPDTRRPCPGAQCHLEPIALEDS